MITFEKAYKKAEKEFEDLNIISCVDIGEKYVFSFGIDKDNIPPGIPMVSVEKENAKVEYFTIPPIENIELLDKGTELITPS